MTLLVASALLFAGAARAAYPTLPPPGAGIDAARVLEAAGVPSCVGDDEMLELSRYRDLVAQAASAEEAREKAAKPSRLARRAIALARWFTRDDTKLDDAAARLSAYEARVARAQTPAEAADELAGLVRVAGDVHVKGNSGGCTYDSTEIIAIILGFIFFIIPGIIMLILFC
jgi:hypothetical protein